MMDREYLGAWDFVDGDTVVEIVRVRKQTVTGDGGKKSEKPVLYLKGYKKALIGNATIGKTIEGLYGRFVEDWVGKRIVVHADTTEVTKDRKRVTVDCVRVRPFKPRGEELSEPREREPDPEMRARQNEAFRGDATPPPRELAEVTTLEELDAWVRRTQPVVEARGDAALLDRFHDEVALKREDLKAEAELEAEANAAENEG